MWKQSRVRLGALHLADLAQIFLQLAAAAQQKLNEKTKPISSLGTLETLAVQMVVAQQTSERIEAGTARLLIFAADHGIAFEGVSAYPQSVTQQMLVNIGLLRLFSIIFRIL